jgi:undecaprenyl pyrophosphate phosphatase UppP
MADCSLRVVGCSTGQRRPASAWISVVVAAITSYLAIGLLLRVLARSGLLAYAIYCFIVGALVLIVL